MQNNTFTGRVAANPEMLIKNETKITTITLITNEFAGTGKEKRTVYLQFKAFGARAEGLSKALTGDLLQVQFRIENNNYTDSENNKHYGYNFIINGFEFLAAGKLRKDKNLENDTPENTEEDEIPF